MAAERDRMRMSLVFPINPSIPSTMSSFGSPSVDGEVGRDERGRKMYEVDAPRAMPRERRSRERGRKEKDMRC